MYAFVFIIHNISYVISMVNVYSAVNVATVIAAIIGGFVGLLLLVLIIIVIGVFVHKKVKLRRELQIK